MYFDKEVMIFNQECKTKEEVFAQLTSAFLDKGVVKYSYLEAISEREKVYPTGLLVNGVGIAIPHTDVEHVNESQVAFMSLKDTVKFSEMTDLNSVIDVKLIFMLALKEPHEQPKMLQSLINLFQNAEAINRILCTDSIEELKEILKENDLN